MFLGRENPKRVPFAIAPGKKRRNQRQTQRWHPVATEVEVRQRLELPPPQRLPMPSSTDRRLSTTTDIVNKRSSTRQERGKGPVHHLARHDTTPGVYPDMSDTFDEEERPLSAERDRVAPVGLSEADHGSDGSSFSRGSRVDTSDDEGGSAKEAPDTTAGTTAAGRRKPRAKTKNGEVQGASPQAAASHATATKQANPNSNTTSKTTRLPLLRSGGENSRRAKALAPKDEDKNSVENTPPPAAVVQDNKSKSGGGFMSKIFGRGKKQ